MQIFVKSQNATLTVGVEPWQTVAEVKRQVQDKQGIPVEEQRLIFTGRQLDDGGTLADYSVEPASTLHLCLCLRGGMEITVKTVSGKSIPLTVNYSDKVSTIKTAVYAREGVPPDRQRLVFAGKQLEDERSLADYNIQKGAGINVVLRLPGGC